MWFFYEIRGWAKAGAELFAEARDVFAEGTGDDATELARAMIMSAEAKYMSGLGQAEAAAPLAMEAVAT